MENDTDIQLIHKFLDHNLSEEEKKLLKEKYETEPEFAKKIKQYTDLLILLKTSGKKSLKKESPFIRLKKFYFAIAAGVLLFIFLWVFTPPVSLDKLAIENKKTALDTMQYMYQVRGTGESCQNANLNDFPVLGLYKAQAFEHPDRQSNDNEDLFYKSLYLMFQSEYSQSAAIFELIINEKDIKNSQYYYPSLFYLFLLYLELGEYEQAEKAAEYILNSDDNYVKYETEKILKEYSYIVYLKLKYM